MNFVDIIIIILLVVLISLVFYFSFIRNRKNPCHNCPYSKKCDTSKCFAKRKKDELK